MSEHDYPKSVEEILDPKMTFKPEALRAVRRFAKSKPWQGTYAERLDKFETLLADLSSCYGIQPPILSVDGCEDGDSGRSCFIPALNTIRHAWLSRTRTPLRRARSRRHSGWLA